MLNDKDLLIFIFNINELGFKYDHDDGCVYLKGF